METKTRLSVFAALVFLTSFGLVFKFGHNRQIDALIHKTELLDRQLQELDAMIKRP
jgi:hypothetical protein